MNRFDSKIKWLRALLKALRPHQWLKNTLVFVPMLTAHQFTAANARQSLLAFAALCFLASSAYVLNDLLDLNSDRAHPRKRHRPFASGALSVTQGVLIAALLLIPGFLIALSLGKSCAFILFGYFLATAVYSLYLKKKLIIDICTLAGLYTLRLIAGGVATGIPLSMWLLAFSIFFFFALAAVKRQAELVDGAASGLSKANGRGYRMEDLPIVAGMAIAAGYVSVVIMALYLNSPAVLGLYSKPYFLWGVCFVLLYWISRMVLVTHRGDMHDDPLVYAVKDRASQICLLLVLALTIAGAIL